MIIDPIPVAPGHHLSFNPVPGETAKAPFCDYINSLPHLLSSHPHTHVTMVQSGKVYLLTDRQSYGTLDLSGQDWESVIGYPRHRNENQRVRRRVTPRYYPTVDWILNLVEISRVP